MEANTQAIQFSKTQPGNSPRFSPFSEYTVVARHYLCIVSLKPSKPKLWFSCWKSSVPWLRYNSGHSSKGKKAAPQCAGLREPTGEQREPSGIQKTWSWAGGTAPGWGGRGLACRVYRRARGQAVTALPEISQKPAAKRKKLLSVSSEDKARYQGVKLQQGRWGLSLGKAFKQ